VLTRLEENSTQVTRTKRIHAEALKKASGKTVDGWQLTVAREQ
jgi:hypothetical protein